MKLARVLISMIGACLIKHLPHGFAEPASEPRIPEVTQHRIIPLMHLRCTVCHGLRQQEGQLDLRSKASMLKGGKSGPALVSGNSEASLIYTRVVSEQCPPKRRMVEASVKQMESSELALLKRWIELGAPEVPDEVALSKSDRAVTEADRQFWAFQPPKDQPVPKVQRSDLVRNPIDAFILAKLESKGLSFSPEANRETLVRRVYLDLIGLPPEPDELQAFVADPDPLAYEKLVDRLLVSPHYGERWGRHWLDVAGYADSEGKREQDQLRPDAYRYRDYVIQSFNRDKPYDRFLLEQLAGDELAPYDKLPEIPEPIYDNLVATGFLRMAPDSTVANITAFVPDRLDVIADAMDIFGSGVLGLTIACARCHSHKFDPIPQQDYYRIAAAFKGAYDEHDWLNPNLRKLPHVTTRERQQWERHDARIRGEIESIRAPLQHRAEALKKKHFDEQLGKLPSQLREDVQKAFQSDASQRDTIQKYLVEKFQGALLIDEPGLRKANEEYKKAAEAVDKSVQALEKQRLPEPSIRALWDRGEPSPTYLLTRGDYLNPGPLIQPDVLSAISLKNHTFKPEPPWPGAQSTGRRLALARWLTSPDHPLTARVLVNRVWKHHFEHGIVKSLGNFGRTGTPPTHPELLDWMAREFVRNGWSIKGLHRLIMTSRAYRQSSRVLPEHEHLDPANDWLSRYPLKRVEAEVLRDSILFIARRFDPTQFGPPDKVQSRPDGLVTSTPGPRGWRRSVYVQQRRKEIPSMLEAFDLPQMNPNCLERPKSIVATQALHLMNNRMIHELAESLARRIAIEAGSDPETQARHLYAAALSRPPNAEELQITLQTLHQLKLEWARESQGPDTPDPAIRALANVCHALVNSAEFIFVD